MTDDNVGPHPNTYNHLVPTGMLLHKGGTTVAAVALCGYTWVPTGYDVRKTLCPACDRIALRG